MSNELLEALKANDELFQLEVTSSYNFHPEEDVKVQYWRKVINDILPSFGGSMACMRFTADSIRSFWSTNVRPRTLGGLPGIQTALIASGDLWVASEAEDRAHRLFESSSGLLSIVYSVTGWLSSSLLKRNIVLTANDEVYSKHAIGSIARQILSDFASTERGKSVYVLTEFVMIDLIQEAKKKFHANSQNVTVSSSTVSDGTLVSLVFLFFVEELHGEPFIIQNVRAVKLTQNGRKGPAVNSEDMAYVSHQAALHSLDLLEQDLEMKLEQAESKCRAMLREGRKLNAANFLKEKKIIENKISELHTFRQKINENSNVAQTAKIQQMVVDTLSWTSVNTKSDLASLVLKAEETSDSWKTIHDQVNAVKSALATNNMVSPDDDAAALEEELRTITSEQQASTSSSVRTQPTTSSTNHESVRKSVTSQESKNEEIFLESLSYDDILRDLEKPTRSSAPRLSELPVLPKVPTHPLTEHPLTEQNPKP